MTTDPFGTSEKLHVQRWNEMFSALKDFKAENDGSCDVPKGQKTKDGQDLSRWCTTQRVYFNKGKLSAERQKALDDVGFDWDPIESQWNEMFEALKKFKAENDGSCNVPTTYTTLEGKKLGVWCSSQRTALNNKKLSPEKKTALEDLGFLWSLHEAQWGEMFEALKQYKAENNGSCDAPHLYKLPDGTALGIWCNAQRAFFNKGKLSVFRQKALEDLGFQFRYREAQWNEMFEALKQFKAENDGSCDVPQGYTTPEGKNLGNWCGTQKVAFNQGALSEERFALLQSLDFVHPVDYVSREDRWTEMFDALKKFKAENDGSCDVHKDYTTPDGNYLGNWCSNQRSVFSKGTLADERKKLLEDLGFNWNCHESQWDEMFSVLKQFMAENNGSCYVPARHITKDGKGLGQWCSKQRLHFSKGLISEERVKDLKKLGFRFSYIDAQWNEMLEALNQFKAENNGSCDVPVKQVTKDGKRLGDWCITQKMNFKKGKLSAERKEALEGLGFRLGSKSSIGIHQAAKEIDKLKGAREKIDLESQGKSSAEAAELYLAAGQSRVLQKAFRDALMYACNGTCVATGSKTDLKATHFHQHQSSEGKLSWSVNNTKGMLLTSPVHKLYESGKIEIDSDTGVIKLVSIDQDDPITKDVKGNSIHGKRIAIVDLEDKKTWPIFNSMPPCPSEFDDDADDENGRPERPGMR